MIFTKLSKEGDCSNNGNSRSRLLATMTISLTVIVALFCGCFGISYCKDNSIKTNAYADTILDNCNGETGDLSNDGISINETINSIPKIDYSKLGYKSLDSYYKAMDKKRAKVKKDYAKAVKKYKPVVTKTQKKNLRKYKTQMLKATSPAEYKVNQKALSDYNSAYKKYKKLKAKLNKSLKEYNRTGGYGKYTGGSFKDPYGFRSAGVLSDSKFRYTYYSSRVLYHYKTPQWTLCNDGLYRDSKGRVVVASDSHSHGTVLYSPTFGACIVQDCGVGRSDTLDVYVGF